MLGLIWIFTVWHPDGNPERVECLTSAQEVAGNNDSIPCSLQSLTEPIIKKYFAPAMTMARALSVTPVASSVCTYVCLSKRRPLSKSNSVDQNFMKLGHIDC